MNINYREDALLLIKWVEAVHPIFYLNEIPPTYEARRNAYSSNTETPMPRWSFLAESMKYLAVLNDGHMGGGLIDSSSQYLLVDVIYRDGKLYTLNDGALHDEIIAICDVLVQDILKAIDVLTFAENEFARIRLYKKMCRLPQFWDYAGCKSISNPTITLKNADGEHRQEATLAPRRQHSDDIKYIIRGCLT